MEKDRYRMQYSARIYEEPWEKQETFFTTGQSANIGNKKYLRHCGPVAVTNLVMTLLRFQKSGENQNPKEKKGSEQQKTEEFGMETKVFCDVAETGRMMLIYHNIDLFGKFGGTSDLLIRPYLVRCLRKYGLQAHIGRRRCVSEETVRESVAEGNILYVEFRNHPLYGNHHVICYSAQELLLKKNGQKVGFYLKCADGWTNQAVYLTVDEIPFGSCFYEIKI